MTITQRPRICVIGGGPAGLSTLYALTHTPGLAVDPVLFDKQSDFGGTWIFNADVGIDRRGGGYVPSAMYADLYTNGPKEAVEWAQFTFDDAFDNVAFPSFPPREVLLNYQRKFARRFDLYPYARFDTCVDCVTPVMSEDGKQMYQVSVRKVDDDDGQQQENDSTSSNSNDVEKLLFDKIVVCTGHFTKPYVPDIVGRDLFKGSVTHACHIRDLTKFKNKRILAVGRSYSGESVVLESYKAGAKQITMSYRSRPNGLFDKCLKQPHSFDQTHQQSGDAKTQINGQHTTTNEQQPQPYFMERPKVQAVLSDGETVQFVDGSHAKFDMIVLCTGYMHTFPFMHSDIRLADDELLSDLYIASLYNGVLLDRNPDIAYIGMQDLFYSNTLFMQQALWLARVYANRIAIPSTLDARKKHSEEWMDKLRRCSLDSDEEHIQFQTDHVNHLTKEAVDADDGKDDNVPNVDTNDLFVEWEHTREENILTHREVCYKSKFTGSMAAAPGKSWLESKHAVEYMGDAGNRMRMMDFHQKLGGLPFPPNA